MTFDEKREALAEIDPEIKLADGFEDALIGFVQRLSTTVALYDRTRCLQILMDRDGLSLEEAVEHFNFNVVGAWVGESTPAYCTLFADLG